MDKKEYFETKAKEYAHYKKLLADESVIIRAYYRGCETGYQYALQNHQWIPVEERLPEEGGYYLVSDGTDSMVDIWLYGVGWSDPDNNNGRVTHWMPMPAPPQKNE